MNVIFFALFIILAYTVIVISSCSPIHLRIWVATAGILTIVIAYIGCYSICGLAGWRTGGIHQLLAFVLICIGVDDIYVIVNVLDQTDFNLPLETRFKIAFYNAGTNVTVTTLTNVASFSISSMTKIITLRSFCIYATVGVALAYFLVMTTFSCILVWDT